MSKNQPDIQAIRKRRRESAKQVKHVLVCALIAAAFIEAVILVFGQVLVYLLQSSDTVAGLQNVSLMILQYGPPVWILAHWKELRNTTETAFIWRHPDKGGYKEIGYENHFPTQAAALYRRKWYDPIKLDIYFWKEEKTKENEYKLVPWNLERSGLPTARGLYDGGDWTYSAGKYLEPEVNKGVEAIKLGMGIGMVVACLIALFFVLGMVTTPPVA